MRLTSATHSPASRGSTFPLLQVRWKKTIFQRGKPRGLIQRSHVAACPGREPRQHQVSRVSGLSPLLSSYYYSYYFHAVILVDPQDYKFILREVFLSIYYGPHAPHGQHPKQQAHRRRHPQDHERYRHSQPNPIPHNRHLPKPWPKHRSKRINCRCTHHPGIYPVPRDEKVPRDPPLSILWVPGADPGVVV